MEKIPKKKRLDSVQGTALQTDARKICWQETPKEPSATFVSRPRHFSTMLQNQAERNLKKGCSVQRPTREKEKSELKHNQTKQQRGKTKRMDGREGERGGGGSTGSTELLRGRKTDARRPAGSQHATPGGFCKPVSGTRLQRLAGSLWGISSYGPELGRGRIHAKCVWKHGSTQAALPVITPLDHGSRLETEKNTQKNIIFAPVKHHSGQTADVMHRLGGGGD